MMSKPLKGVMQVLETTPDSNARSAVPIPTVFNNDISNQRQRLAVLISTGKSKEAIAVQVTHERVKRLTDKEVAKFYKRYAAHVGNKVTESPIDSFIMLVSKGLGMLVSIDDVKELQKKDLKKRLHHQPRNVLHCGQPLPAMWPAASGSQYCSYHNKTHRF